MMRGVPVSLWRTINSWAQPVCSPPRKTKAVKRRRTFCFSIAAVKPHVLHITPGAYLSA